MQTDHAQLVMRFQADSHFPKYSVAAVLLVLEAFADSPKIFDEQKESKKHLEAFELGQVAP